MFSASKSGNNPGAAYTISRSVRLRSSASAYLNRTPASASNRKTWTWSGWVKRGLISGSATYEIFMGDNYSTSFTGIRFYNDSIYIQDYVSGSKNIFWQTSAVFRDPSAWYHVVVKYDTTQASSTNAVFVYVNGVSQTLTFTANTGAYVQNYDGIVNSTSSQKIGAISTLNYFDGYLTEINFIDGQALTPSSFGVINSYGVWSPIKYSGTYGTNGFYLNFSDNSAATAAAIGKDSSGNGNNWTPNNISLTAGSTYDSMLDVPTLNSATVSNFAVWNAAGEYGATMADGNLKMSSPTGAYVGCPATINLPSTGKWYWEGQVTANGTGSIGIDFGIAPVGTALNGNWVGATNSASLYGFSTVTIGGSPTIRGTGILTSDILQVAYDAATGNVYLGLNNTFYTSAGAGTGNPSAGTGPSRTLTAGDLQAVSTCYNQGQIVNFGQRPFSYTPPTGFLSLNTYNLPTPTISNGASYMAATTYTGTGASLAISNTVNSVSFQPDFVWVKGRSGATDHALYDSVRGTTKDLASNSLAAETTQATGLTAFGTGGFTVGALAKMNTSLATYVGWQWKAGTTSASNTNGSITSTVSVGAAQGFSVVTYTGTGANATVGHGLGVAPSMVIVKCRSSGGRDWPVYHIGIGNTKYLALNDTVAAGTSASYWNNTSPTSSVFSLGSGGDVNTSSQTLVAYCFAAIAGYSAFGSYTGNGSADGPFVYLGFRPKFIMVKPSSTTGDWNIFDTSRDTYNQGQTDLFPNSSSAEYSGSLAYYDNLSNGFKMRNTYAGLNGSGGTYIYMAFAENPFKYALAR